MLHNYLITAIRSFARNRTSTLVNFLGLTIGMAAGLIILLYVDKEMSFDSFHEHKDEIYRVALYEVQGSNSVDNSASNYYGVGEALVEAFPEIQSFVTLHDRDAIVRFEDQTYREEGIFYTEPHFLDVFSFPLLKGDAYTALDSPDKILVSDKMAKKYFGSSDPVGQRLQFDSDEYYVVSGVVSSTENSHIQFDFLLSNTDFVENQYRKSNGIWNWSNFYVYILTDRGVDPGVLHSKFPPVLDKHIDEGSGVTRDHFLQPLDEIYLSSNLDWEMGPTGNGDLYRSLLVIALLILLIAWVNYVNLSTAQSSERAREVGLRKVVGASKSQLVRQFLLQSFVLNLFSLLCAFAICQFTLPLFENVIGVQLEEMSSFLQKNQWKLMVFFLLGTLASGIYPAFVLSSFKPVSTLSGRFLKSGSGLMLRKGLTVFQYTVSIVLMICTIMVFKQLNFMRSQNLGFTPGDIMVFESPILTDSTYLDRIRGLKSEVESYPDVLNMAVSSTVPSKAMSGIISGFRIKGTDISNSILMEIQTFDEDFLTTYDMKLVVGRNFDSRHQTESRRVLLNRSGVHALGFESVEDAVDRQIQIGTGSNNEFDVVGIVEDYHHVSLRSNIEPQCIIYSPDNAGFFSFRLSGDRVNETIRLLEEKFIEYFPGNPINHFFLDESLDSQYQIDQRLGRIILMFSSLAILIACLGLFGLMAFMAHQRTREIGIRKVLGATPASIVALISGDSIRVLGISIVVAVPLAIFGVDRWLETYAYQTSMDWWVFLTGILVTGLIALVTISFQSVRTALTDPVNALKEE